MNESTDARTDELLRSNLSKIQPTDIALFSFPRSGNTWLRYCLSDLILQTRSFATATRLPVSFINIIPTLNKHRLDDAMTLGSVRIFKTHMADQVGNCRFIYVVRNPLDSLRSFYRYETKGQEGVQDLDEFCRIYSRKWTKHVDCALKWREKNPSRCIFVSYEEMHRRQRQVLRAVSAFCSLPVSKDMISKAISNHQFDKQLQYQLSSKKIGVEYNLGEGQIGLGSKQLPESIMSDITAITGDVWQTAQRAVEVDIEHWNKNLGQLFLLFLRHHLSSIRHKL